MPKPIWHTESMSKLKKKMLRGISMEYKVLFLFIVSIFLLNGCAGIPVVNES